MKELKHSIFICFCVLGLFALMFFASICASGCATGMNRGFFGAKRVGDIVERQDMLCAMIDDWQIIALTGDTQNCVCMNLTFVERLNASQFYFNHAGFAPIARFAVVSDKRFCDPLTKTEELK